MQACLRAVFPLTVEQDIEILVCHRPGVQMACADTLSRAHTDSKYRELLQNTGWLDGKSEVQVQERCLKKKKFSTYASFIWSHRWHG